MVKLNDILYPKLQIGDRVVNGPHWRFTEHTGKIGTVCEMTEQRRNNGFDGVAVMWDGENRQNHYDYKDDRRHIMKLCDGKDPQIIQNIKDLRCSLITKNRELEGLKMIAKKYNDARDKIECLIEYVSDDEYMMLSEITNINKMIEDKKSDIGNDHYAFHELIKYLIGERI